MKLSSLIDPKSIHVLDSIDNIDTAMDFLIQKACKDNNLNSEFVKKSIEERGFDKDLILDNKIAIPHGRLETINDTIVYVLLLKKPVKKFNKNIQILFLLLTSKTSSTIYLQTLSSIYHISLNNNLVLDLQNSKSGKDFTEVLDKYNIYIKKELNVSDIMSKELITVKPSTNIKELIDIFAEHKLSYILVTNDKDELIGELNINDIIKVGIPSYAEMLGNLNFLPSLEPFEELLKNEERLLVGDIMKKPKLTVSPDASIMELASKLTKFSKRHAPVVKEKSILGVVSLMDVLMKILRGKKWI